MATTAPRKHESIVEDGDEYTIFRNVPVFDEHEGDDGVFWDRNLLQCIATNNNDRIEDTGDWCPIIVGHTPDPDDDNKSDNEIIGYAGPFNVSTIGNKRPRAAIIADFRIFNDKLDTYRQNPRRSVELWPEDNPTKAFFDPIAVLGAETPRRALGIVYSRLGREGKRPIKYEMGGESVTAAAPGGNNTFIPGGDNKKKKHAMNEDISADFTGKNAAQLLEAFKPEIQQIAAETVNGILDNQISTDEQQEAEETMTPENDPALMEPPADPLADPAMGMDMPPAEPGLEPGLEPMAEPAADPLAGEGLEPEIEEPSAFSKYFKSKLQKYMADEEIDDHDKMKCAKELYDKLDDDDKTEALSILEAPGDEDDDDTKAFYAKCKYMCDPADLDDEEDEEAEKNSKYAKKYRKEAAERKKLAQEVAKYRRDLQRSQRAQKYAKIQRDAEQLSSAGFVHDEDLFMELAPGLSDRQYKLLYSYAKRSVQRFPKESIAKFAKEPKRQTPEQKESDLVEKAEAIALQYRKEGKKINFKKAMDIAREDDANAE